MEKRLALYLSKMWMDSNNIYSTITGRENVRGGNKWNLGGYGVKNLIKTGDDLLKIKIRYIIFSTYHHQFITHKAAQ